MNPFHFNLPTEIHFTDDHFNDLKTALEKVAPTRILLVYGMHSLKTSGLYDGIIQVFNDLKIPYDEVSEIPANPTLSKVYEAQALIQNNHHDFILAAGGGSVMDAAKAIAVSAFVSKEELWPIFKRERWFEKALPLGVFVTLSGTGSEVNGNSVINNDYENVKWSIGDPLLRPKFAIINPAFQLGLKSDAFIATTLDIIHHTLEQYFDITENTSTSDYLMTGLIKSVRDNLKDVLNDDFDLDTYKNLSWASTIGLSFILQQGKVGAWESHRISYPLTANYGIIHGYALSMVIPAFLTYTLSQKIPRFEERLAFLGQEVFDGEKGIDVIERIKALYRSAGAPVSWNDANLTPPPSEALIKMGETIMAYGDLGKMTELDAEKIADIYALIEA